MLTPEHLEITADGLTAVLALWLGTTVLTRSRTPPARIFGVIALALVAWSTSVIVQRLTSSVSVADTAHATEELAAAIILPATAHFSLLIATEGHPSRFRLRLVGAAYVLNLLFVLPGLLDPANEVAIHPPYLVVGPIPGPVLGWAWILTRLAIMIVSAVWLLEAWRATRSDAPRHRVVSLTLATVVVGSIGGTIRLFSVVSETDPWIGVSLVTVAMVLAASAVFSSGVFFAPDVSGRAFRTSLVTGLGVFLLVAVLLGVDAVGRGWLGLDLPLLTVMVLVITVAAYEPLAAWMSGRSGDRSSEASVRRRLLTAFGPPSLSAQAIDAGVQPALSRLTRTLELAGAAVTRSDGSVAAATGTLPDVADSSAIRLVADDEVVGELRVGRPLSGGLLSPDDEALIRMSAGYLAIALRSGRIEAQQVEALTELLADRANVESTGARLQEALIQRSTERPGLRVFALGPFRVDRGGTLIDRWGGEKAGTRQAQGLFAFLFDRGDRGVGKDEALELIWPDTDLERADLAFHRTLGGLRRTLDPSRGRGKQAIRYHNDRYRLDPEIIAWSDLASFLAALDEARLAADPTATNRLQEAARALYRGEYLDDCPFYGDSVHVEERRSDLRDRYMDLLIALGERYETTGDHASAATAYRDAIAASPDGCPPAAAGLSRLASRH